MNEIDNKKLKRARKLQERAEKAFLDANVKSIGLVIAACLQVLQHIADTTPELDKRQALIDVINELVSGMITVGLLRAERNDGSQIITAL